MALPGTLFEYLAAFATIIVALAIGDMLASLHRLIRQRRQVRWAITPLAAAVIVFLALLTFFFEVWEYTAFEEISYWRLVYDVVNLVLIFLAASAVLPDRIPDQGLDLAEAYLDERGYLYGVLAVGLLLDSIPTVLRLATGPAGALEFLWTFYLPISLLMLAATVTAAVSRRMMVHRIALALMAILSAIGFSSWTVTGPSALSG